VNQKLSANEKKVAIVMEILHGNEPGGKAFVSAMFLN